MTETEGKWAERVRQWRASGQTAAELAHGKGYEPSTLRYWASMLKRRRAQAATVAVSRSPAPLRVRMLRVQAFAPAGEPMVVAIGAARVEVRAGFDRLLLRAIVEAVGGCRDPARRRDLRRRRARRPAMELRPALGHR